MTVIRYILGAALLTLAAGASAQGPDLRAACMGQGGMTAEQRRAACTALADAPAETPAVRATALNFRAQLSDSAGDRAAALADYGAAIRIEPRLAASYQNRGDLRAAMGDAAGARADYDAGLRVDPRNARLHVARGNLRREHGDVGGALADYDRAVALDPRYPAARNNRGNLHRAAGRLRTAQGEYVAALRLDPAEPNARSNLCITRHRLGERGAMEDCERAIREAAPGNPAPFIARGGIRLLTRDDTGASADIAEALRRDPASAVALELRALLLMRHGDAVGAARDTAAARAIRPRVTMVMTEVFGNAIMR